MILNCALPYRHTFPNPAVGYLKGFLQAEGISVKNVYWNLVMIRRISEFLKISGTRLERSGLLSVETIAFYIFKQLLGNDSEDYSLSKSDALFSSIFSRDQLSNMVDSIKEDIDCHIQQNNLHEAPIAGFTLKTFQWLMGYHIIRRLKEMNPDIKIIIGGIYDEPQALAFMKLLTTADFAIWGEGEIPLVHFVKALQDGTGIKNVPNLVYRTDNKIKSTGKINNHCPPLDSYPFADHTDYFDTLKTLSLDSMEIQIPIWGSRSCNWNKCRFCVLNEGYTYRTRSPENIVEEIEFQSKKHNINDFVFVDNDVAGNKKRFKALLKLLIQSVEKREKPYRLFAEASPLFIDSEIAKYMKLASFIQVQIGFEAVTDSLLEKMQKRHRFAHNIQALKLGNQYGVGIVGLNIIRGIPTETKEDVLESCTNLKFLRFFFDKYKLSPNHFMLFKRSLFYKEMQEEEREQWRADPLLADLAAMQLIPESDRFEFSGFCVDRFNHHFLWSDFEHLLSFYAQRDCSYEWFEYSDGSYVEERGLTPMRHALDQDETDILIFCDSVRTFPQIKRKFSHLSEDKLLEIVKVLNNAGFLYCDKSMRNIISILEAAKRKTL